MIGSDGWDSDPPADLEAAWRCRALIWLDPLMDHPRYFASARGMHHASADIDLVAPARNVAALGALADRLSRERVV